MHTVYRTKRFLHTVGEIYTPASMLVDVIRELNLSEKEQVMKQSDQHPKDPRTQAGDKANSIYNDALVKCNRSRL